MTKQHIIKSLKQNEKWLENHNPTTENNWRAEDILIGCSQLLRQCNQGLHGWMDRKPHRKVLGRIQKSWATRNGKRTLRELIAFTIAAVEANTWTESYWTSLPTREAKKISESQKQAMQAGRRRAKANVAEAIEARLAG